MKNRLKETRKEKGFTRIRLSIVSNTPIRTLEDWESGGFENAKIKNVKRVADALGVKVDDLIV